jgi:hypothetical protein
VGNPKEEREVFTGFLAAMPMFADSPVMDWQQPAQDPPDVVADLADGRKVAVELTSWLDESQIGREKKIEMVEASFRDAIQPEPPNETEHIFLVWLAPRRRLLPADRAAFRSELLALMEAIDRDWDNIPSSDSPQGFDWKDFAKYPTLEKHLDSLDIHPRRPPLTSTMRKGGLHWLTFPARGGAYSPDWMVDALVQCVTAKTTKYAAKPPGVSDFHLLVHYDRAFIYNSPVLGIGTGYREAVEAAASRIGGAVGVFDKIFVYVPVADGPQAFQLYP